MKKLLLPVLSAVIFLASCKKDDTRAFDESFDERINGSMAKYQAVLTGAQYGWKAFITTDNGNGGTYSFYMRFNDSNRVTMVSDFDTAFAITPKASGYRLRQQQQPTLIFDTYSYVHILADPNENVVIFSNVNNGAVGQGLLSDFEFIINPNDMTGDTIRFTGKVNGARLVMTKATQAEQNIFLGGQWVLLETFLTKKLLTYYKRITIGGVEYDMSNDPASKTITFRRLQGSNVVKHETGYYNTIDGIVLYDPLSTTAGLIDRIDVGDYDATNNILNVTVGTQPATISETVFPLKIETSAPQDWWNFAIDNGETYWISFSGFHVDGVDDAHKIRGLSGAGGESYYYLIYWPKYAPNNFDPSENDLFGPVFLTADQTELTLLYAAAPAYPVFTGDGILKFRSLGNYGTYPTASTNPARKTRNLLFQNAGFYFVKISETQYDMVSAFNGRAWLRWDF